MNDDLESRLKDVLAERGRVDRASIDRALGSIDDLPVRPPRLQRPVAGIAAALVVALLGVGIVALLGRPTDTVAPDSPSPSVAHSPSTSAAVASPSSTVAPSPSPQQPPVWAVDLASHLDCDGPPSTMGMDTAAVPEPFDPGATPQDALDNVLIDYVNLPTTGYTPPLVNGHWALHRYLVDGRPKIHAVSTNQFPGVPSETRWQVVGLRACDPSEFAEAEFGPEGATLWRDADGNPVHSGIIVSLPGPAHCGYERTVWLMLGPDRTQYFRDPNGDLAEESVVSFDPDVRLPEDAIDTGLHTDEWAMFTIPSGRAVYMRTRDGTVERWPRARDQVGCA